jgi:hypothetical protein
MSYRGCQMLGLDTHKIPGLVYRFVRMRMRGFVLRALSSTLCPWHFQNVIGMVMIRGTFETGFVQRMNSLSIA